jgi:hypothetical protein
MISKKIQQIFYPSLYFAIKAGEEWKVPFVAKKDKIQLL